MIAPSAYIDETALVIGDVSIGEHNSLWPMVVARGDVNRIVIGAYTNIQDGSILHGTHDGPFSHGGQALYLGDRVTVGHQAILTRLRHRGRLPDRDARDHHGRGGPETKVVLAAGSLVPGNKVLEGGFLGIGSPARRARHRAHRLLRQALRAAQGAASGGVAMKAERGQKPTRGAEDSRPP